jgi:hypothetical protein
VGIAWRGLTRAGWLSSVMRGPLIHLDELGCLDLLEGFGRVLVPRRVWEEVGRHRSGLPAANVPRMELTEAPVAGLA